VQSGDYNNYIFSSDHERQLCNSELVSTRRLKMGFQQKVSGVDAEDQSGVHSGDKQPVKTRARDQLEEGEQVMTSW
jgi:hypothetical protein